MESLSQVLEKLRTRGPSSLQSDIAPKIAGSGKSAGEALCFGRPFERISVTGLGTSGKAFILAALCGTLRLSAFVVTATQEKSEELVQDLDFFLEMMGAKIPALILPPQDTPTAWSASLQRELTGQRMHALLMTLRNQPSILFTPISAAIEPVPPPRWLQDSTLSLCEGDRIDRQDLIGKLVSLGYHRCDTVEHPGDFAVRGGIVDIYGSSFDQPVRLELAGDSLESLREFDAITQRTIRPVDRHIILPADEPGSYADDPESGGRAVSLAEYLPAFYLHILDEPEIVEERLKELDNQNPAPDSGEAPPKTLRGPAFALCHPSGEGGDAALPCGVIELKSLALSARPHAQTVHFGASSAHGMGLGGKGTPFEKTVATLDELRNRYDMVVICRGHDQQQRLGEILTELEIPSGRCQRLPVADRRPSEIKLALGHLSSSFFLKELGLGFLTEEEIFGKPPPRTIRRARLRPFLTNFEDLKPSDYVVHVHYGIGRFRGLQRLAISGFEKDFLVIEYADGGKVYVPLDHLDLVQKYIGAEGAAPRLDRLGTATWERTKQKVKKAVRKMAGDLIQLYAWREVAQGFPFSPDSITVKEFEATFEFEETPDQLRSIEEVKRDMEKSRPMDRVVCGDVGYGKTEVAMRASMKAVLDNKQVALLVPTTLLAQQHYQTFSRRFSAFPVQVEMLSRFRTPREQKTILRDLDAGKVDILIGTHRLLQKDLSFRDMGLVIIDEEHRFGVSHKESFKKLRRTVDVLTLTATPIPRTLQMALTRVRDLSLIDTPPPDRLAVKTYVASFDRRMIREAIIRELGRDGQVFFVHNRIKDIEQIARLLKEMVPQARISIAHGQMRERELETVMRGFVEKRSNLLLSTAIIESGLDIPDANTIIINRADRFGLADLYQLRGRVGRSRSQAYAYLLVPDPAALTEDARKRLLALQEFSELGAGFKIAARDLEIRGAGNLLGSEQSGHIAAVGFELYLKMIDQAVQELKGRPTEEEVEPSLNLRVSAYLPDDYIPDSYQRLVVYKRLAALQEKGQVAEIREELIDRFGPPPPPVRQLLQVIELKIIARLLKITRIDSTSDAIVIAFHPTATLPEASINRILGHPVHPIRFLSEYSIQIDLADDNWDAIFDTITPVLQELIHSQKETGQNGA